MSAKCQKQTFMDVPKLCLIDPTELPNTLVHLDRTRFQLSVGQQDVMSVATDKTLVS